MKSAITDLRKFNEQFISEYGLNIDRVIWYSDGDYEYHDYLYLQNKDMISVIGLPVYVRGSLHLYDNRITHLTGISETINGSLVLSNNKLRTIDYRHFPKLVNGFLDLSNNPLEKSVTEREIRKHCTVIGKVLL